MKTKRKTKGAKPNRQRRFAEAQCWTARPETPRTDAVEYSSSNVKPSRMSVDADFARQLEMELAVMCDFINREMKMTASDPRISTIEKRIAALSNAEVSDVRGAHSLH